MSFTNQNEKAAQLQALEMARDYIENNQEIPNELSRILFPPEKREYELIYWGKESKEQILTETIPVPLQEDKIFPPNTAFDSNEWVNKLNYATLTNVVDEMISTKNILLDHSKIVENEPSAYAKYSLMSGSTIYRETGITKRAIENQVPGHYFDKIQHAETAQEFSHRKTNIFSKVASKFKTFFEKLENPQEYEKKQSEIGNQAFEGR